MARKPRIEYEGAVYHVMCRGNRQENIYKADKDCEMFLDTLRRAAWQAGRSLQLLQISGAGADHPFLVHVPEGRYLKAVFCRVE